MTTATVIANAALRRDPTRTTTLRAAYAADIRGRFRELARLIRVTLVDNDALNLRAGSPRILQAGPATRFDFATSPDKVAAFMDWFRVAADEVVLRPYDPARAGVIPNAFIRRAAMLATQRADAELAKVGLMPPGAVVGGIPEQTTNTLRVLYTRNYEALRGITEATSAGISRELSQGVLSGLGPRQIARDLVRTVDRIGIVRGTMLARTEVIHAYAETSLDRYEQLGVQGVTAMVEFATAGDDRVCEQCQGLEGEVRTIAASRGVIPVHPQCRCTWLPVPLTVQEALVLASIAIMPLRRMARVR